jgi:hypothetical protein
MEEMNPGSTQGSGTALKGGTSVQDLRAQLRPVALKLKKAQAALKVGPLSLEKARKEPEAFQALLVALGQIADPSKPDKNLEALLRPLTSSRKKVKAGFDIPSAEVNWGRKYKRKAPHPL